MLPKKAFWKAKSRAQSGLEYLMTYGWALILVATIIGVLVFVSSGNINTNTCPQFIESFPTPICKDIGADKDKLILILQNATAQKITINPFTGIGFNGKYGYAKIIFQGKDYLFEDVEIPAGSQFRIEATGMALEKQISITYTESTTGITRTITSPLGTDAPDDIELSNDGIDNDGDGLPDCADPDTGYCYYVQELSATQTVPSTWNSSWSDITFDAPAMGANEELTSYTVAVYAESFSAPVAFELEFDEPPFGFTDTITKTAGELKAGWNFFSKEFGTPLAEEDVHELTIKISVDRGEFNLPDPLPENQKPKLIFEVETT